MAFLKVIKGSSPGQVLELFGERVVLGRHPDCQIVLDKAAVSRHHAQILESHGRYYIEDLRSRNGTFVNGTCIEGRFELQDADQVKVCDVVFTFCQKKPREDGASGETASTIAGPRRKMKDSRPSTPPPEEAEAAANGGSGRETIEEDSEVVDGSSIISTLDVRSGSDLRLDVKPEAKLRAVLEIGNALARAIRLSDVLDKILDGLFKVFPQADEGFVMLKNAQTGKLMAEATRTRSNDATASVRISMTIVQQALQSGEAILSADAVKDDRFRHSESMTDLRIRSMMCVPLIGQEGERLGVIQLATRSLKQQFSKDDLDVLASVASQASLAVENAHLHEQLVHQRDIERDLEVATQIQLGFLPNKRPKAGEYEFYDYYEAAQSVGGDYFDYIVLPDERIAVAIADVAGKGVPAALLMARLYSSARLHLLTEKSVAGAMTALNAEIASSGLGFRFITCVLVVLDPRKHEIAIANAGHPHPLLKSGRKVQPLAKRVGGMPLGVSPDQKFRDTTVPLKPDDMLVLYTDGITEAMNARNELYGSRHLSEYVSRAPANIEELVQGLVLDVERFCEHRPQRDDMCLVGLRRVPPEGG